MTIVNVMWYERSFELRFRCMPDARIEDMTPMISRKVDYDMTRPGRSLSAAARLTADPEMRNQA